jgi:hypothetical protein
MILITTIIIIITITIFYFLSFHEIETFASIRIKGTDDFKAVELLKYNPKKDLLIENPTQDYFYCKELCKTSEKCNAFNYALNKCSLYQNASEQESMSWLYRNF